MNKFKKLLVGVLAAAMTLSMSATAFADDTTYTDQTTVTVKKVYKLAGEGSSPAETFTLTQTDSKVTSGDATEAPALGTITGATFTVGAATAAGAEADITIVLPIYDKVGVYEYTLNETVGTTAGVTYRAEDIKLVVTVINGDDGNLRIAGVHTESSGTKTGSIENTYSANKLTIHKDVEGNLGDKSKYFAFDVTLTGETGKIYADTYAISGGSYAENPTTITIGQKTTVYLKDDETLAIENLPAGVAYVVQEQSYLSEGYSVEETSCQGTISADAVSAAVITNTKTGDVDTGVNLDSLPYILALVGVVVVAGAAVVLKRRKFED